MYQLRCDDCPGCYTRQLERNFAVKYIDHIEPGGGDNAVANRHKWRNGHESVANCQAKELSNFSLNFLIFQLNQFVSLFSSNGSCNWVVKIYTFWKKNMFSVF
jgi:hypothetical protein